MNKKQNIGIKVLFLSAIVLLLGTFIVVRAEDGDGAIIRWQDMKRCPTGINPLTNKAWTQQITAQDSKGDLVLPTIIAGEPNQTTAARWAVDWLDAHKDLMATGADWSAGAYDAATYLAENYLEGLELQKSSNPTERALGNLYVTDYGALLNKGEWSMDGGYPGIRINEGYSVAMANGDEAAKALVPELGTYSVVITPNSINKSLAMGAIQRELREAEKALVGAVGGDAARLQQMIEQDKKILANYAGQGVIANENFSSKSEYVTNARAAHGVNEDGIYILAEITKFGRDLINVTNSELVLLSYLDQKESLIPGEMTAGKTISVDGVTYKTYDGYNWVATDGPNNGLSFGPADAINGTKIGKQIAAALVGGSSGITLNSEGRVVSTSSGTSLTNQNINSGNASVSINGISYSGRPGYKTTDASGKDVYLVQNSDGKYLYVVNGKAVEYTGNTSKIEKTTVYLGQSQAGYSVLEDANAISRADQYIKEVVKSREFLNSQASKDSTYSADHYFGLLSTVVGKIGADSAKAAAVKSAYDAYYNGKLDLNGLKQEILQKTGWDLDNATFKDSTMGQDLAALTERAYHGNKVNGGGGIQVTNVGLPPSTTLTTIMMTVKVEANGSNMQPQTKVSYNGQERTFIRYDEKGNAILSNCEGGLCGAITVPAKDLSKITFVQDKNVPGYSRYTDEQMYKINNSIDQSDKAGQLLVFNRDGTVTISVKGSDGKWRDVYNGRIGYDSSGNPTYPSGIKLANGSVSTGTTNTAGTTTPTPPSGTSAQPGQVINIDGKNLTIISSERDAKGDLVLRYQDQSGNIYDINNSMLGNVFVPKWQKDFYHQVAAANAPPGTVTVGKVSYDPNTHIATMPDGTKYVVLGRNADGSLNTQKISGQDWISDILGAHYNLDDPSLIAAVNKAPGSFAKPPVGTQASTTPNNPNIQAAPIAPTIFDPFGLGWFGNNTPVTPSTGGDIPFGATPAAPGEPGSNTYVPTTPEYGVPGGKTGPALPPGWTESGSPTSSTESSGGLPVNLNPFDPNSAWSANTDNNPNNNVNWNPFDGSSVWYNNSSSLPSGGSAGTSGWFQDSGGNPTNPSYNVGGVSDPGYSGSGGYTGDTTDYSGYSGYTGDSSGSYEGGGSCPFVYSWDGEKWNFDHESFPFAVTKAGETTSYGRLENLKAIDGKLKLQIREQLPETSWTDFADIYSVEHPGNSIVMPDINGIPHTIQNKIIPETCTAKNNDDCLGLVKSSDEKFWTSNLNQDFQNPENYFDWVDMKFAKPAEAKNVKIGLNLMKSEAITWAWQHAIDEIGKNNFSLMEKLLTKIPELSKQWQWTLTTNWRLTVEIWDGSNWTNVDTVEVGREKWNDTLVFADISNIKTGDLKIRLKGTSGFYEINSVFVDYSQDEPMNINKLEVLSAVKNNAVDVKNLLANKDEKYVEMNQGDSINLELQDVSTNSDWNKDYLVKIRGYYHFRDFTENQSFFHLLGTTKNIIIPFLYKEGFEASYFMQKYVEALSAGLTK